jgi:putative ABC transport system permease protein
VNYFRVVFSTFSQRTSQVVVTFFCLLVSFLLLGLLLTVRQAFTAGADIASSHRLRTQGASSVAASLPVSYAEKISQIEGVKYVMYAAALPAAFQDDPRHLLLQAVPQAHFFDTFPELDVSREQQDAFMEDKTSIMVGQGVLDRYGWKLGQNIVLQTNVLKPDGEATWTFHLDAVYRSSDPKIPSDLTFIRYDYLNDARLQDKNQVLGFIETIGDPSRANTISENIDASFATSAPQLKTQPENEEVQKQLSQFGDFSLIVVVIACVVFVSMFLLAHNVWYERADMRRHEFAVMKVMGFQGGTIFFLIVTEATMLTLCSAIAGMGLAAWITNELRPQVSHLLAGFYLPTFGYMLAMLLAIGFGVLSSVIPARRAANTPLTVLSGAQ